MIRSVRIAILLALVGLLSACATPPAARPLPPALAACERAFVADDARLVAAGIHDAQAQRVPGYPYLRVDRLLASFSNTLATTAQRAAWLAYAAALDEQGRALEHTRLSPPPDDADAHHLQTCRATLTAALRDDDAAWPALLAAAHVADDYSTPRRALGLYALSSRLVLPGVKRMQRREMPRLVDDASAAAVPGERYGLDDHAVAHADTRSAPWPLDALGLPRIDVAELARLFRLHAPDLSIVTANDDDIPGHIARNSAPFVDIEQATLYTQLAFTRFGDAVLPQLVYTWWFAARDAHGVLDPLAGALDGLSWRVTLDRDGQPLAYDVIHNCGCYHMFFPSARLRARTLADDGVEPPWIPFTVPAHWRGRVRLALASGSHYLTALAPALDTPPGHRYVLRPYDELRSFKTGDQRVSLFDDHGLVPGSARGERWFLWPMGVLAPGSMRQWGHQATAFVGRRHFDEARLFERYFERVSSMTDWSGK